MLYDSSFYTYSYIYVNADLHVSLLSHAPLTLTPTTCDYGNARNLRSSLGVLGVPRPVTGSHPVVDVNPGVPCAANQ